MKRARLAFARVFRRDRAACAVRLIRVAYVFLCTLFLPVVVAGAKPITFGGPGSAAQFNGSGVATDSAPAPPASPNDVKTFGGSGTDTAYSIVGTRDGGYLFAGDTTSFGASGKDFWAVKVDAGGAIQWQKRIGGAGMEGTLLPYGAGRVNLVSVVEAADNGFALAGATNSSGAGAYDAVVIKLDSSGNVAWQKTYGGTDNDAASSIFPMADGGFIVGGTTYEFGRFAGLGGANAWVLRLNADGTVRWQNAWDGLFDDYVSGVVQTTDGGYGVTGWTYSYNGLKAWAMKLDANGSLLWFKTVDSSFAWSIAPAAGGGFVVSGESESALVQRFNADGTVAWQRFYGGVDVLAAEAFSIIETTDGGFAFAGFTGPSFIAGRGMWVVKLDATGAIVWQKRYGSTAVDKAYGIAQTADGGFAVAGTETSGTSGTSPHALILKLDANGNAVGCSLGSNTSASASPGTAATSGNVPFYAATSASVLTANLVGADIASSVTQLCAETSAVTATALGFTAASATTSDFHDAAQVQARLTSTGGAPVVNETVTFTLGSGSSAPACLAMTDAAGTAACLITPSQAAGQVTLAATFAGDASFGGSSASTTFTVTKEETTLTFTAGSPTLIANGQPATFAAALKEDGTTAISGRAVTITLGSGVGAQSCTGTTNSSGTASCTINVNQPLGPNTVVANFSGDAFYRPASDTEAVVVFAFLGSGSFVIGDLNAVPGNAVTFWGAKWAELNSLSGGPAPEAFKGFADTAPQSCGGSWSSRPGNSSNPPDSVPSFMAVIASSSAIKSGPIISGNVLKIVIVRANPGYGPAPGHTGTGTVVGVLCSR